MTMEHGHGVCGVKAPESPSLCDPGVSHLSLVLDSQLWTKSVERSAPPLPAPPPLLPAAQDQGPRVPDRPSDISG